jgi:hypothetical protein
MPVYKYELAPNRPTKGYDSHTARRARLEHQALAYIFDDWDERTADAIIVVWGGKIEMPTKLYLGTVVVDHPQPNLRQAHVLKLNWIIERNMQWFDVFCSFIPSLQLSHQRFLDTSKSWAPKTTAKVMAAVIKEVAGGSKDGSVPVVEMGSDERDTRQGLNSKSYQRGRADDGGFHLLFDEFWLVSTFCIFQMYMRDSLHQVDHGILLHVCRGILRLFLGE